MMEHGTSSSLDHKDYGLSAIIWTSMITGKDRNEHAIHDFLTLESPLFERQKLISSNLSAPCAAEHLLAV